MQVLDQNDQLLELQLLKLQLLNKNIEKCQLLEFKKVESLEHVRQFDYKKLKSLEHVRQKQSKLG
jgi:hypothetical protein